MKLIFLRHGKTMFNDLGLTQGQCDSPLTPEGRAQAEATAALLRDIPIHEAYSSTSDRAYDTAEIALGGRDLEIHRDRRLKELFFGWYEGSPNRLRDHIYQPDFRAWEIDLDYASAGGESSDALLRREMDFLNELTARDEGQTVLIAGHGIALTVLVHHLAHESIVASVPDFRFMGNACAVILDYHGGSYAFDRILGSYAS